MTNVETEYPVSTTIEELVTELNTQISELNTTFERHALEVSRRSLYILETAIAESRSVLFNSSTQTKDITFIKI